MFFYCVYWEFSGIRPSWFSSHSIIRFDLGIIRRPGHCSECLLSSIRPSTKHYLEVTNRPHWSSTSVMYFQRFRRWPIFTQLWANVACFLANNAWYPESSSGTWTVDHHWTHCSMGIERGVAGCTPPPPLFTYPKQKHDHISLCIIIIRPFEALYKFLKISGSRTPLGHSQL